MEKFLTSPAPMWLVILALLIAALAGAYPSIGFIESELKARGWRKY